MKTQVQGVHHITLVGSNKQSALDFWQGVLGMPFLFEQPNLGKPDENHLYFDPGDGRLLTVFTNESRKDAGRHAPREVGCVEHLAFNVSRATFALAPARLRAHQIEFIRVCALWPDTPALLRAADVLVKAFSLRVERGDHHITEEHLADAIEWLIATRNRAPTK